MLSRVFGFGRRSFCVVVRTGNPGARDLLGRGRRPHLPRLCRRPARRLSRTRPRCSRTWRTRRTASRRADRAAPQPLRRTHPADPPRACARLSTSASPTGWCRPLGIDKVRDAGRGDGGRRRIASTSRRRSARPTPRPASCSAISRWRRQAHETLAHRLERSMCRRTSAQRRSDASAGSSC